MMRRCVLFAIIFLLLCLALQAPGFGWTGPSNVGGGYAHAGMTGAYYATPGLSGTPAFTRKDVRLDFDWGLQQPVGGSIGEPYRSFPTNNFSVRWTGQIIPRFAQVYTLKAVADHGMRVKMRKAGTTAWTTVIDAWRAPATSKGVTPALQAGALYDLQVDYCQLTGHGRCKLLWSSPSTPEEVIDPVIEQGLNIASFAGYLFADRMKDATRWTRGTVDENGMLTSDGELMLSECYSAVEGTYHLVFGGKAEVNATHFPSSALFTVAGKTYSGVLPSGVGYDAATNTTTADLKIDIADTLYLLLAFNNTSRDGSAKTNTGLSFLKVMRPIAAGSDTPHNMGEITYRPLRVLASDFTCLRYLGQANFGTAAAWAQRTKPSFINFSGGDAGGENWEYLVLMANETGRDLYLTLPINADDDYVHKLALLLKYGSDGDQPYTSPQAHPVYPPLNPNLRVYLEFGNEIWNWGFYSTQQSVKLANDGIKNNTPEAKVYNYDGKGNWRTWHALRTVRMSDTFRSVFGDAAMGSTIRVLLEYQYWGTQMTAYNSLNFIDRYFNNGDGQHVTIPHPVNYYVWGGGSASYYGTGNSWGDQSEIKIPDASFERCKLEDGTISITPQGTPWKFTGDAGIYRNYSSLTNRYLPGKSFRQPTDQALGCKFTVGEQPLYVNALGRVFDDNSDGARLQILRADTKAVVAEAECKSIGDWPIAPYGFYYANLAHGPAKLEPNTTYYLLATDLGHTSLNDADTRIEAGPGLTVQGAAKATMTGTDPSKWTITDNGKVDTAFGAVTMLYARMPNCKPDAKLPTPPEGTQAAFLCGAGEMSITMNFPTAGAYALVFSAQAQGSFRLFIDDQPVLPSLKRPHQSPDVGFGGWGRNKGFKEVWGSEVFKVTAGTHTIRFVRPAGQDGVVALDNIGIASADAIMESGFGSGSALGQASMDDWKQMVKRGNDQAHVFGLPCISYESGWSLGGDFTQRPIQNYCKLFDPRAMTINDRAYQYYRSAGGYLSVWGVYTFWPLADFAHGEDYPIMRSFINASNALPSEALLATPLPASLTSANYAHFDAGDGKTFADRGDWYGWTISCTKSGRYNVTVDCTKGGTCELEIDGKAISPVFATGDAGASVFQLTLSLGMHGVRLRDRGGSFVLNSITVAPVTAKAVK